MSTARANTAATDWDTRSVWKLRTVRYVPCSVAEKIMMTTMVKPTID
jgi:hypothetical protein